MRTLKLVVAVILALALMIVVAANMEPVDLELWPEQFGIGTIGLYGVPLALVIFVALVLGFVIGELTEWSRERKYRAELSRERRRMAELKAEHDRLLHKTGARDDELALIGR
jgi:uncharacterized integral membrane protein